MARGNSPLNRWMGLFAERLTWSIVAQTTNVLRQRLALAPYTARSYSQATSKIPALYAISPQVVPPTTDTNSHMTGYWFLDEAFTPPADLVHFIENGEPPIYFGFGSMPDSDPAQTLEMVSQALARIARRGVVVSGWSEIVTGHDCERVFLLKGASHAWLFPRMAALVHHGGAGTAAAGLRAGKPALLIPHMGDQPFWARRLWDLGVSPKPVRRHELSVDLLAERLGQLINDVNLQARAVDLGEHIVAEEGIVNATDWLSEFMNKNT